MVEIDDNEYFLIELRDESYSDEVQEILDDFGFEFRDIKLYSKEKLKEIVDLIKEQQEKESEDEN
jgi:hypothetical protein